MKCRRCGNLFDTDEADRAFDLFDDFDYDHPVCIACLHEMFQERQQDAAMNNPCQDEGHLFERQNAAGDFEYSDGTAWFEERNVCRHCQEQHELDGTPFAWADERHSFGVYAGRYCDKCWVMSGYRDATDPDARFDPMDAGEVMEPEDY